MAVNHLVVGSNPTAGAIFIMTYHLYVLENLEKHTYVGQTNDLERRLLEHNDPNFHGTLYTKRFKGPWRLIYEEELQTRSEAMLREKFFKTGKGRDFIAKLKKTDELKK